MYTQLPETFPKIQRRKITVIYEGQTIEAYEGDSVAGIILSHETDFTRHSAISGAPRLPYCMMGVCFECLMDINGVPNTQACMTIAHNGMVVCRQVGTRFLEGRKESRDGAT